MKFSERMLTFFASVVILVTLCREVKAFDVHVQAEAETQTETIAETTTAQSEPIEDEVTVLAETIPEFVYEEEIPAVPLYFQQDYAHVRYGNYGTVSSHGCGITSLAMVFSYLFDEPIMPDRLAGEYGHKNHESGSCWSLFTDSAKDYDLEVTQTGDWSLVEKALKNGQVVIANARKETVFTTGGHYIVLAAITENDRVIVRDPNKYNYNAGRNSVLGKGFAEGFEIKSVKCCTQYWIYPRKDIESLRQKAEKAYYGE